MLFWILACKPITEYEQHTWSEEVEQNRLLSDAFFQPVGFHSWNGGWMVADKGADALLWLDENSEVNLVFDDLNAPKEIVSGEAGLYLSDAETIYLINEQNQLSRLVESRTSPHRLIDTPMGLLWIEENDIWQYQDGQLQLLLDDLLAPYDMVFHQGALYISTQDDRSIWRYQNEALEPYATLEDVPHCMAGSAQGLLVTTRSSRWPFGGWIVSIANGTVEPLTQSPPEPEYILSAENVFFWSSKQSIAVFSEAPYSMVEMHVAVGDMKIVGDALYWSDQQNGSIGYWPL